MVNITLPNGQETRKAQVLEIDKDKAILQVFNGTLGMDCKETTCEFSGKIMKLGVCEEMLGRVFDGMGRPKDGGPPILPEKYLDIHGQPINPAMRDYPSEMIQTGISSIDLMMTVCRGAKMPIFTTHGLPADELAAQIVRKSSLVDPSANKYRKKKLLERKEEDIEEGAEELYDFQEKKEIEKFCVVFAGMGVTSETSRFFMRDFVENGYDNHQSKVRVPFFPPAFPLLFFFSK